MAKYTKLTVTLVTVILLAAASAVCSQPEEVLLRYEWTAGEHPRYDMSVRGEGQIVIYGIPGQQGDEVVLPVVLSMDSVYGLEVKAVDEAGNATIVIQWEPMHISVDAAGRVMQGTIDMTKGTITVNGQEHSLPDFSPEQQAEPTEQLEEEGPADQEADAEPQPPTMKISPRGQILEVSGLDRLMPMMEAMGWGRMNPSQLARTAQPYFPEEVVAAGEQWEQDVDLPYVSTEGQQEPAQMHSTNVVKGFATINEHPCVKINTQAQMEIENLSVPEAAMAGIGTPAGRTTKITALNVAMDGDSHFDYEAGKLIKSAMDMTINLEMNMTGQSVPEGQIPQIAGLKFGLRDLVLELEMTLKE